MATGEFEFEFNQYLHRGLSLRYSWVLDFLFRGIQVVKRDGRDFFSSPAMPKIMGVSGHDNTVKMAAEAGTEVVLPCEAQGSPSPLVTWRRNGHLIPPVTAG